jgi:C-terminal processing protease CtpA/Prc
MKNFLTTTVLFIGCFAFGQNPFQTQKLEDFAKLYGVVRYFHPSDEAAKTDWKAFAVYAVKEIDNAKTQKEFEQKLQELFSPLAPSISFDGNYYQWPENAKYPVYWEHRGLGIDNNKKTYSSERYNKTILESEFKSVAINLTNSTLIGKKIKLTYEARSNEGKAYCFLKILDNNKKSINFATHQANPVVAETWQPKELIIEGNPNLNQLTLGLIATDGNCDFRNLKLYYEEADLTWKELQIPAFDTKNWYKINDATYTFDNEKITVINETNKSSQLKNTDVKITWDKFSVVKLSNNLNVIVPIVVFANEEGTLPKSELQKFNALKQEIHSNKPTEFTSETSLANLIISWNIFKHFFPYQKEVKVEWDKILNEGIKDAFNDTSITEHKLTLEKFTESFDDAHIAIYHSKLKEDRYHAVPVTFRWVGNQLVVKDILKGHDSKLKKGDIITEINNVATNMAFDSISQYISGSKQLKRWRSLKKICTGKENSSLQLKTKNGTVENLKRVVKYDKFKDFFEREETLKFKKVDNTIFYINLEKLNAQIIDSLVPTINEHKGLIIDLRGYPYNDIEHRILSYTKVVDTTKWLCRAKILAPNFSNAEESCAGHRLNNYKADKLLTTKNVLLVDERTVSNAEMLAQVIKHYKIATIVGRPTTGANGNINPIGLLNGFQLIFTGMKVTNPDGSQFHSIGVIPDIIVEETIENITEGKDTLIEKAIEVLNKEIQ